MTTNPATLDRLFVDKVYTYVADPAFDGNVQRYLTVMVEEYRHQARVLDGAERISAAAKAYAYADALRVLDDAVNAALTWATGQVVQ